MHNLIQFTHALADKTRWRILQLIFDQALCVCELADILKMKQSSVSSHLQVIRKAKLLDSERREKWVYYRVIKEYHPLLLAICSQFNVSPVNDITLACDAKRSKERLRQRAESCCPGPRELVTKESKLTKTKRRI